jgi:hypothetical protein
LLNNNAHVPHYRAVAAASQGRQAAKLVPRNLCITIPLC